MDNKPAFYFLLCGTLIMIIIMHFDGKPLVSPETSAGIISLELAGTKIKTEQVIHSWAERSTSAVDLVKKARVNTYIDFIFLFFYSLFLYVLCRRLAIYVAFKPKLVNWLNRFAYIALLAGLLDVAENIGMLILLNGSINETIALYTATTSLLKWTLVSATLLMIIIASLVKLSETKQPTS